MTTGDITELLSAIGQGDKKAKETLYKNVYRELRAIAHSQRRRWQGNETLNTTAIIHEAYAKMANAKGEYENRTHFFATAARAMRQVLVSYAERSQAQKRSRSEGHDEVASLLTENEQTLEDLLMVNQLLTQLENKNSRHCQIVECRVFGGMSIEETAIALGISAATVKRDWTVLRTWLYKEILTSNCTKK